jgi:carboxyl-terminal processing protease
MKTTITYFTRFVMLVAPLSLMMATCEDELIGLEKANTPTNNFEYFWRMFDYKYGLFEAKKIDWNAVYSKYRPQINDQMTEEELYKVLTEMIVLLNDNHVNIYPTNGSLETFPGGVLRYVNGKLTILKAQEDYDIEVAKKYLKEFHETGGAIRYGRFDDNIGYINIASHTDSRKNTEEAIERALIDLRSTKGIIIDVRGDTGGHDALAQYVAGRFTTIRKLYMTTRKRNGEKHNDFTEPLQWFVAPTGEFQYANPVIVLTSRFSQSAAETFTLAMKELEHVTIVGDTTAGSYSDNPTTELLNGWMFSISVGDYRASDGKSYEGIGTAPDVWIKNTKEDLLAGKDKTLEKALSILNK